ncbi:Hypothetical predicted protein [Octopus vulgaris]|uniref:Uncharacterized protein n=1 Tax=Octopus vulgaris TaxID=6645 RepID=A0AA36B2X6_OCTVU|nr:Hypothetical predicted protein [Octopus vulgaris]
MIVTKNYHNPPDLELYASFPVLRNSSRFSDTFSNGRVLTLPDVHILDGHEYQLFENVERSFDLLECSRL